MKNLYIIFLLSIFFAALSSCSNHQADSDYYLFVGTYTGEGSEGIYLYKFSSDNGTFTAADTVSGVDNPSYLTLSPDNSFIYAVNELADSGNASVSAFAFDKERGKISFINRQSSRGGAPCYVSMDKSGEVVFVGNYLGGSLAMLPVNDDGSLAEAKTAVEHEGSSVNESRQESSHVHCTLISPDNKMLFVADLGTDKLTGYSFDEERLKLISEPAITFETEKGAGPRHITFHPNGEYAYLVNELNGTVDAFFYDGQSIEHLQTISTLPDNFEGAVSGADIHVSPGGKFLYVSNREDLNNIVIYSIEESTGRLSKVGEQSSGGVHPRNFMIDPTGKYLLVANRHTDNIVVFRRSSETGLLKPTGNEIEVSQPVSLQMAPVIIE